MNARTTLLGLLLASGLTGATFAQTTITLEPSQDNTLFEDANGGLSNGQGPALIAGRTLFVGLRRALLQFDVAGSLPAGATVTSAQLVLSITRTAPGTGPMNATLHRVSASWGEGASSDPGPGGAGVFAETGDATWTNRFYQTNSLWANAGGDFVAIPSATASTGSPDSLLTWNTVGVAADVQAWSDGTSANHGWMVRVDEAIEGSAARFASREYPSAEARPHLTITFTAPPSCLPDFNQDGDLNPDDLGDFITCYFGTPPCDQADFNHDNDVNPDDLGDFITAYFQGC